MDQIVGLVQLVVSEGRQLAKAVAVAAQVDLQVLVGGRELVAGASVSFGPGLSLETAQGGQYSPSD